MRSLFACRWSICRRLMLLLVMVLWLVPHAGGIAGGHGREMAQGKLPAVAEQKKSIRYVYRGERLEPPAQNAHRGKGLEHGAEHGKSRQDAARGNGHRGRGHETVGADSGKGKRLHGPEADHPRPRGHFAKMRGGIAIDPQAALALIVDGTGLVHLVALPEGESVESVPLSGPAHGVAVDAGRRLALITLSSKDRLALYTLPELQPAGYVTTNSRPMALAYDSSSGFAAVASDAGDLELIDIQRRTRKRVDSVRNARELAMQEGEQRLWITLEDEHRVAVLDMERRKVLARIPVGKDPGGIAVSTKLRMAVVANRGDGTVSFIDIDELRETRRIPIRGEPAAAAIDDEGRQVLVADQAGGNLWLLDAIDGQVIDRLPVEKKHPLALAVDADNRIALLLHRGGDVGLISLSDTRAPEILIDFPPDGWATSDPDVVLQGSLDEDAALAIDGQAVEVDATGRFTHRMVLRDGSNIIEIVAVDRAGNVGTHMLRVELDREPPPVPLAGRISLVPDEDGTIRVQGAPGSVESGALVRVINTRTGVEASVVAGADGSFSVLVPGTVTDRYLIRAIDGVGNQSAEAEVGGGNDGAPDPEEIAPPSVPGPGSSFADMVGFLLNGDRPVQSGAVPGIIDPSRVAALRGRVLSASGSPLAGVRITVHGHPEFGYTLTRRDGMFDLLVNGGGWVVLDYELEEHLPAQRRVEVSVNDFTWFPDVMMLALDQNVTSIMSGASEVQIARGSVIRDVDGERQLTMIFPAGTRAELLFADGSRQAPELINVRATEYTLSDFGPRAMPGELPPTSAWTYAVELSVDEAISAGASEVRFDRPISVWVENFPGFPVGTAVPSAWYDHTRSAWIPAENGRVIAVADIVAGRAVLDVNGKGAASDEDLQELGIDDSELLALAMLYEPGATLWRVPVWHFTPWDFNWPHGPPQDAVAPEFVLPEPDPQVNEPECRPGSIVECENQVLSEALRIAGADLALHYRSDRVPGRESAWILDIPLSGSSIPASLRRIDLELTIAGRQFRQSYEPAPDLHHRFVWDGLDAWGRRVYGASRLSVRVGYVYQTVYYEPAAAPRSFSLPGIRPLFGIDRTSTFTIWSSAERMLGAYDARVAGLGGWTLSAHHAWDATSGVLHRGDGTRRMIGGREALITTIAGGDESGFSGDGGPATAARFGHLAGLAAGADGSVYVADGAFFSSDENGNRRVRRITPDGVITTFAGGGSALGDGGPAALARLAHPADVAVGPDGSVYIADAGMPDRSDPAAHRIRRVLPDGTIVTVAGTGEAGYSGDGGPATEARLNSPMGIAVGADGSLYISDWLNSRIRRVGPDGIITTLAGTGVWASGGDGGRAIATPIRSPAGIAVASDGTVYFADWDDNRIRRIGVDGIISTIAGGGAFGDPSASGVPARTTRLIQPAGIALAEDGSIYVADQFNGRLRRIGPDGIITTIAGDGRWGVEGDGGVARSASLAGPTGVAIGPGGQIYVSELGGRVRHIAEPGFARAEDGDHTVPAADGREIYRFDPLGRHLSTTDALTGAVLYQFHYLDDGRLAAIEDSGGNVLRIEHNSDAVALVAPNGERTMLQLDEEGWLSSVTDPQGATYSLMHTAGGLLTTVVRPLGGVSNYSYDGAGHLREARDSSGGGSSLLRTQTPEGMTVTVSSSEGVQTVYRMKELPGGERVREVFVAGVETERSVVSAGRQTTMSADGTITVVTESPDPRFALEVPLTETTVTTPGGISGSLKIERSMDAAGDPARSPLMLTERIATDDGFYEARFDGADSVWTLRSPSGRTASIALDGLGRIAARSAVGSAEIRYEYDADGRLSSLQHGTDDERRLWRFIRQEGSGPFVLIDPLLREISFEFDAAGRVVTQIMPGGRVLHYGWNADGQLSGVTAPGGAVHGFTWTRHGLLREYLMPAIEGSIRYEYDLDRRPTGITIPGGEGIGLSYDVAGRPVAMSLEHGRIEYSYDDAGRPFRATAPGEVSLSWTWDGFLPLEESLSGSVVGSVKWRWDAGFALRGIELGSHSLFFEHDVDGFLTRAEDLQIRRDSGTGLPEELALGELVARRTYNVFGEPVGLEVSHQEAVIASFDWRRDDLGRLSSVTEVLQGEAQEIAYEYDDGGRLAAVLRDGVGGTMEHDADGNLVRVNGQVVAEYDQGGRLIRFGAESFEYDQAGALAVRTGPEGSVRYSYDLLGNLRHAELADGRVIDYLVDARNRRVGRRVNGVPVQAFLYADQWRPVAELDGAGAIRSVFVYGDRLNVPTYMIREGRNYLIVSDHIGSPRLVVDAADGRVVQRIDYDPRGRVLRDTNPGFQPFGFAGGLYDPDTGLLRFGSRDYDPRVGRWTSPDLLGPAGGDINPYVYAGGDPVNFIDPRGSFALNAAGAAVGAATGALMALASGDPVVAGLVGGAVAGAFPGGGAMANLAIGAVSGIVSDLVSRLHDRCQVRSAREAGIGMLSNMIGSALGRYLGMLNGVMVARAGEGAGRMFDQSAALVSAYYAQTVSGGMIGTGAAALMRSGESTR